MQRCDKGFDGLITVSHQAVLILGKEIEAIATILQRALAQER